MPLLMPKELLESESTVALGNFIAASGLELSENLPLYDAARPSIKRKCIILLVKEASQLELTQLSDNLNQNTPPEVEAFCFLSHLETAIALRSIILEFERSSFVNIHSLLSFDGDSLRANSAIILSLSKPAAIKLALRVLHDHSILFFSNFRSFLNTLVSRHNEGSAFDIIEAFNEVNTHYLENSEAPPAPSPLGRVPSLFFPSPAADSTNESSINFESSVTPAYQPRR